MKIAMPPIKVDGRTKHGMCGTPEYSSWQCMKARCENPKNDRYQSYGGRGIRVCDRWQDFLHFYQDMGPKPTADHSIDRIDNNQGYHPDNCRWASRSEQQRNKGSYNAENLPRGEEHWTNKDRERAAKIAAQNIRKAHRSRDENPNAKMSMDSAKRMREQYRLNPQITLSELSALYGVSRETARKVIRGLAWT